MARGSLPYEHSEHIWQHIATEENLNKIAISSTACLILLLNHRGTLTEISNGSFQCTLDQKEVMKLLCVFLLEASQSHISLLSEIHT